MEQEIKEKIKENFSKVPLLAQMEIQCELMGGCQDALGALKQIESLKNTYPNSLDVFKDLEQRFIEHYNEKLELILHNHLPLPKL